MKKSIKNKKYLDAFIEKCIHKFNGKYCIEEINTGAISDFIISLPTCYFVMDEDQYNYFLKRVSNAF